MEPLSFIAASAEEAVSQIRSRLGPEAVVLNVRPMPVNGLARFWQKPMIEVLAHVPEAGPTQSPVTDALAEFRHQLEEIKHQVVVRAPAAANPSFSVSDSGTPDFQHEPARLEVGQWRVGAALHRTGLMPVHAQCVIDQLRMQHGEIPPPSLGEELALARNHLAGRWRQPRTISENSLHVLIGPAGSGKTTCLAKWLTQSVLVEGRQARVWRLDSAVANMAESLSVHCEILGFSAERIWSAATQGFPEDIAFIDLPGVDWRNPIAVKELAGQLKQFGQPRVHLVLNGACDVAILLAQVRAFSPLPIDSLIVSHLDEESRWGKLWNLVLGTNYSIRFLSTGQNIPGDFLEASAAAILNRQFPPR